MGNEGEAPQFANEAERLVWDVLAKQKDDDWVIVPNLRLQTPKKDFELDFVVLMPDVGVVVVEVKGGSVWIDDEGKWRQNNRRHNVIHPLEQAMEGKFALRDYVERDPRWRDSSRSRIRWGHAIVVPFTDLDPDFATPRCPRWVISGRADIDDLATRIHDVGDRQETGHRRPTDDDLELVLEIIAGRHLPVHDLTAEADEREARADRLTQEQAALLHVTRLIPRMEVRGGAGSGKTILALTQAKELTAGRPSEGRAGQRVALICYSIGLSEFFKRQLAVTPRNHRPAFTGSFEDLAKLWGIDTGSHGRNDRDFWERDLAQQMAAHAESLPDGHRFDAIIVDEAQDFADHWWTPLMKSMRDEETGGLYVYSDENQRIFARFGQPPVPLVPLVLDHNLRNTRPIGEAFGPLTPMRMRLLGGDGEAVRFVPCTREQEIAHADDEVDRLLDAGWQPRHVALLTMGSRHAVQAERWEAYGQVGYWKSFWEDDDVFYGHVLGCKGLERKAVVLCVNAKNAERAKEMLYVGMSRATDQLVVVGDPEFVREIGGEAVARRLGI